MLLESFTKDPSRSTADHIFKSVLCGRCGTVNYHPFLIFKILKPLKGGNATGARQSSMLGFYGESVRRRRNQTCGKLNKRNFCPTSASRHMCSGADKEDGDRHVVWSNDQAEAGAKISK